MRSGFVAVVAGCRPGDLEAIGITASPCGGCRQWLYEFQVDRVTFRNREGELVSYTPGELLPDTWELGRPLPRPRSRASRSSTIVTKP